MQQEQYRSTPERGGAPVTAAKAVDTFAIAASATSVPKTRWRSSGHESDHPA